MTDKVNKATRSQMMSSVKSKNTAPELAVRKALFVRGIRYRLHDKSLPGFPDLVFPKYRAIIFVHGCFWHNHNCKNGALPVSNREFWKKKLQGNALRDKLNISKLLSLGWRVKIIWSCSLKNKTEPMLLKDVNLVIDWLKNPNDQT